MLRLDPAGKPDPSFGTNGVARTSLGQPQYLQASVFPPPQPNGQVVQINPVTTVSGALDRRGAPPVDARRGIEDIPTIGHSALGFEGRLVARLNASGALDEEFGTGGVLTFPGSENRGVAPRASDGSPLTWGYAQIRAFTEDGRFDQGFGQDGLRTQRGGITDLVVDGSGRLLVLQAGSGRACRVVGLRADGGLDRGYGKGGQANPRLPRGSVSCDSIALDPEGGVFVAGTQVSTRKDRKPSQRPAVVFRLEHAGRLDQSFGRGGWVADRLGPGAKLSEPMAVVDPQGRLLVAAVASSPAEGLGLVLFRYLLDG